MSLRKKLEAVSKGLAKSTITTYVYNIKRLGRLAGLDEVPLNSRWLGSKKLHTAFEKLPLVTKKLLATAAVKAHRAFKTKPGKWETLMRKYTSEYGTQRDKRGRTKREKASWPKTGYSAVFKAGMRLQHNVPDDLVTFKDLRAAQSAWLLLLYGKHTPRLINSVKRPGGGGPNEIRKKGRGYELVLRKHKTSKSMGQTVIKLDDALTAPTRTLIQGGKRLTKHPFLLSNAKGDPISRSSLSKLLTSASRKGGLRTGISVQLMRVLKSSTPENQKIVEKSLALQKEMGHGQREALRYSKK